MLDTMHILSWKKARWNIKNYKASYKTFILPILLRQWKRFMFRRPQTLYINVSSIEIYSTSI